LGIAPCNTPVQIVGMSSDSSPFAYTLNEEEIRAVIESSSKNGMAEDKREMLSNIFEIAATQVREVMIPRVEVTAVEIDDPTPKILEIVTKTKYSRIPVYRKNFDNVVGSIYAKDLLQYVYSPETISLRVLLRPIHIVPDAAPLDLVLRQLQSMHLHMAIVVDEFGGVEGIVTLEDLLEEIVGEIRDEHDTEVESIRELGPNLHSIAGNLAIKEFNRYFEEKLPEVQEYATVAGFLEALTGRLLVEGETVRYRKLIFSIEKLDGFRIVALRVRTSESKAGKVNRLRATGE